MGVVVSGRSAGEPSWRAASRCDGGACVEVSALGGRVLVRSSADPDGAFITLNHDGWQEFVAAVKDGAFGEF